MKAVRLFDLKTKSGDGIMDMEEDPSHLKDALWYLNTKTEKMSDDEFMVWLKAKLVDGPFNSKELFEFKQDMHSPEFAVLTKKKDQVMAGIAILIDWLIDANKLV